MSLKRIHWHWTAGSNKVSSLDMKHYHFIIDGDANVVNGDKMPESNISVSGGNYVAHTRGANTGAIGVSVAGMAGAQEHPFDAGAHPIRKEQIAAMVKLTAELCETYGIPVTRETVLMHSEVQKTLGKKQNGKWDLNWLPGMSKPGDAISIGDDLREMVRSYMANNGMETSSENMFVDEIKINPTPTLQLGSAGSAVEKLQSRLSALGYLSGAIDGDFGPATQKAVIAFQQAMGLVVDGIVGPQTWAAKKPAMAAAPIPANIPDPVVTTQIVERIKPIDRADMNVLEEMVAEASLDGSNTLKQMGELKAIAGALGLGSVGSLAGLASFLQSLDWRVAVAGLVVIVLALLACYRIYKTADRTTGSRQLKGMRAELQENVLTRLKDAA